jgi:hypothetical protein
MRYTTSLDSLHFDRNCNIGHETKARGWVDTQREALRPPPLLSATLTVVPMLDTCCHSSTAHGHRCIARVIVVEPTTGSRPME